MTFFLPIREVKAMSVVTESIKQRIKAVARKKNDLKLYLVPESVDNAYDFIADYLGNDERPMHVTKQQAGTIKSTIKANKARYNKLGKFIETEEDEAYKQLYQAERDILEAYAYMTVLKVLGELGDLGEHMQISFAVTSNTPRVRTKDSNPETIAKRNATKAANKALGKAEKDLETDEERARYNQVWNDTYKANGGTDESALKKAE